MLTISLKKKCEIYRLLHFRLIKSILCFFFYLFYIKMIILMTKKNRIVNYKIFQNVSVVIIQKFYNLSENTNFHSTNIACKTDNV